MAVSSQVEVRGRWQPAAHGLYARSVCDRKAALQLRLVALYKCYMPLS